jgi:hypothetical protein
MRAIALTASVMIMFSFFNIAYGQPRSLPKELLEVAKENGCNEVKDFYDRPGMIRPPYVYGYLTGPEENSAAFWCEKQMNGKRVFFLMFMSKGDKHGQLKCSEKLEWRNFPGGLSIYKNTNDTLKDFRYLRDPKKRPPEDKKLDNNGILSEYDGVEVLYYCYKGEWLVRMKD